MNNRKSWRSDWKYINYLRRIVTDDEKSDATNPKSYWNTEIYLSKQNKVLKNRKISL